MNVQYLKTTDPEVLDHAADERARLDNYRINVKAFVAKVHATQAYEGKFLGSRRLSRLEWANGMPDDIGRWNKSGYPYKGNPLRKEIEAIRFEPRQYPGLPETLEEERRDFTSTIWRPAVVVQNGTAYAALGSYRQERPVVIGAQWTECPGSEFHAAVEARTDLETKIRSL